MNIVDKITGYIEKHKKLGLGFTILFFAAFVILNKLTDDIKEINTNDLNILFSSSSIVFALIVILSLSIYGIIDLFLDKSDHDQLSKKLNDNLHLVSEMIKTKGLEKIVTDKEIEVEEKNSDSITLILEDLYLDIDPKEATDNNTEKTIGLYFEEVHNNIKNGKQYVYYLKYDNYTYSMIESHNKSHYDKLKYINNVKEPIFILIPANKYNFFSDIYVYKKYKIDLDHEEWEKAYEYLPNLDREENGKKTMFYLGFSDAQVTKLSHILTNTQKTYGITRASDLQKYEEYIVNQSYINNVEKKSDNIIIITDSLSADIKGGDFFDAVKHNIDKNKKYTYYVPNTDKIRKEIEQFKEDHLITSETFNVVFKKIPLNSYLFYSNIFIYNSKDAFEFLSSTNQYFKYEPEQCKTILSTLDKLEGKLS